MSRGTLIHMQQAQRLLTNVTSIEIEKINIGKI